MNLRATSDTCGTIPKRLTFTSSESQEERKKEGRGVEKVFEEIMAENLLTFVKDTNLIIQEAQQLQWDKLKEIHAQTHSIIKL